MSRRTIDLLCKQKEKMAIKGKEFCLTDQEERERQVNLFKHKLEEFLQNNRNEITSNPETQNKLYVLCRKMGVEPLTTEKSYFFYRNKDFYNELTVQIIEECYKSRESNGGIIEINKLCDLVNKKRKSTINQNDIFRAINQANCLGEGLKVVTIHQQSYVISVPFELADDQQVVLSLLEKKSYFLEDELLTIGWSKERVKGTLVWLLNLGILWVDDQFSLDGKTIRAYWMSMYNSF
ncbi:vacuolar-sorting protein SNF8, putative [Entamoeba dispar SAW760]|uniref:Vacuolar-sorting protein SNF8, putative n=1 Tax=Entamoeba dispar (strain ATCC PRA-260 / SAW760) TaxID=370354 RepID=B0EGZ5_ENTDS|nr:vacuolar-sorting protein SNF8, putative [Entamoeba dispar SAW760]EDR26210.1 vacuolar-sorting protein SNF8, putative [Entamoeba dispar SAW760]|eukprot:EDR26210.1 vacuolar-sorting protein SNF8, putative [Entamoeba dispar SAW760]